MPGTLTVAPGTKVSVRNEVTTVHTLTAVTSHKGAFDTGDIKGGFEGTCTAPNAVDPGGWTVMRDRSELAEPLENEESSASRLRQAFRTQLWPLPTVGVVLGVAAGVGLPEVDARMDGSLPAWLTRYLFGGGATSARYVLSEVAGSLITVTSLTFSLTVVTLQLASSQFSPRCCGPSRATSSCT